MNRKVNTDNAIKGIIALNRMLVRQPKLSARTEKRFREMIVPTGTEVFNTPMAIPISRLANH